MNTTQQNNNTTTPSSAGRRTTHQTGPSGPTQPTAGPSSGPALPSSSEDSWLTSAKLAPRHPRHTRPGRAPLPKASPARRRPAAASGGAHDAPARLDIAQYALHPLTKARHLPHVAEGAHVVTSFDDAALCLTDAVRKGVSSMGYEHPSPVQSQSLLAMMAGYDVIVQANSGLGKTGAYLIPLLAKVDRARAQPGYTPPQNGRVAAIILVNASNLAHQIAGNITAGLGKDIAGLSVYVSVGKGGRSMGQDRGALRDGVDVLVGTPGRILGLMTESVDGRGVLRKASIDPWAVRTIVFDEADLLMDRSDPCLAKDVNGICQLLDGDRCQRGIFSATFPESNLEEAGRMTRGGETCFVQLAGANKGLPAIKQYKLACSATQEGALGAKIDTLCDIYTTLGVGIGAMAVVFCNAEATRDIVCGALQKRGLGATTELMEFRRGRKDAVMLVATDALARGIDVQQVQYVFNVDLPQDRENYVHRIGRCGRLGRKGCAITMTVENSRNDRACLYEIEDTYGVPIETVQSLEAIRAYVGSTREAMEEGRVGGGGGSGGGSGGGGGRSRQCQQQ